MKNNSLLSKFHNFSKLGTPGLLKMTSRPNRIHLFEIKSLKRLRKLGPVFHLSFKGILRLSRLKDGF